MAIKPDMLINLGWNVEKLNLQGHLGPVTQHAKQVAQVMNGSMFPALQKNMKGFSGIAQIIKTDLIKSIAMTDQSTGKLTKGMEKFVTIVKMGNNQLKQMSYLVNYDKMVKMPGVRGKVPSVESFTVRDYVPENKGALQGIDIGKLAARAALTIPVWLALRAAIMGTIDVIPNAINRFKELDTATASMKVLTDGAADMIGFNQKAMQELNKLSKETGTSATDLADIYKAVSSTGIDAETSFSAMETIAKGAIATQADAKQLATVMSGLINTMGDTLDVGATKGEKFQVLMVLLHSAMKTNAGQINDFADALGQAGSSAATSGMKLDELVANVAVLQTAMVKAGMGGTALRSSLDQVVQKRQEIANLLDREIKPEENKNQFTLIRSVIDKIREIVAGGDLATANRYMADIFGVKAAKNVNVLRSNLDKFVDTFDKMQELLRVGDYQGIAKMSEAINRDFDEMVKTAERQQARLGIIFGENMRQLIANAFGFSDSEGKDAFKSFVDAVERSESKFIKAGEAIHSFAQSIYSLKPAVDGAAKIIKEIIDAGTLGAIPGLAIGIVFGLDSISAGFTRMGLAAVASSKKALAALVLLARHPVFLAIAAAVGIGYAIKKNSKILGIDRSPNTPEKDKWDAKYKREKAYWEEYYKKQAYMKSVPVDKNSKEYWQKFYATPYGPEVSPQIKKQKSIGTKAEWEAYYERRSADGFVDSNYSVSDFNNLKDVSKNVELFARAGYAGKGIPSVDGRDATKREMREYMSAYKKYAEIYMEDWKTSKTSKTTAAKSASGKVGGKPSNVKPSDVKDRPWTNEELFSQDKMRLESLKSYGIDAIQLKEREIQLIKERLYDEDRVKKTIEAQIELEKMKIDLANQYAEKTRSAIESSLLGNLQGKGNNLFTDLSASYTAQLQESLAKNLSNVIMSTGFNDPFAGLLGGMDEATRTLTDPIIQGHTQGSKVVYDAIVNAFNQAMGKAGASNTASMGTAGYSGSGNGLPGVWGSSMFTQGAPKNAVQSAVGPNGQPGYRDASGKFMAGNQPNFWGKAGATASVGSSTALLAAGGVQQMRGGGAKNIVGGAGQTAMAIGMGAAAMTSMAVAGSGTLFAAGIAGGAAAGGLAFLGPLGLILGATLMIASMFMKGAKQTSTSTQTNETKVGSKISITNQKLDLVNRNLIALRNTLETYALATSSYFSEKSYNNIDAQFALSTRRSA